MIIRDAILTDVERVKILLEQLGYPKTLEFVEKQLKQLSNKSDYRTLVCEMDGEVVGLMTIHFWLQIGFEGETCNISFFVVDENIRSKGVGKAMEEYCTALARERGCFAIELFSLDKRVDAHRFYERQGYQHIQKYFIKELV